MQRLQRILVGAIAGSGIVLAQPAGPVRFTEVLRHEVRQAVDLPGTVESRTTSVIASEAVGLVLEMAVRPGESVAKGQLLVRLRDDFSRLQLEAAEGRMHEATARLDLAESKLERVRSLHTEQIVSQNDLDDAVSERAAWQGRVDATRAEIGQIRLTIERSSIRAPFDGVVTAKRTDLGQWVVLGGPVMEMIALADLQVEVEVPERYYSRLAPNTEALVTFPSLAGYEVVGRVERIVPRADLAARSFPAKVRIPNPDGRIGVGMLAAVAMPLGDTYEALLVPKDSLVRQGETLSVFRIRDDQTVEPVVIRSGQGIGPWIVVEGGVAAGQRVVTRGNERLRPGQAVDGEPIEYPRP